MDSGQWIVGEGQLMAAAQSPVHVRRNDPFFVAWIEEEEEENIKHNVQSGVREGVRKLTHVSDDGEARLL